MRRRWIKRVAPTFVLLMGLPLFIRDEIQVHAALNLLAKDRASCVQVIDAFRRRNDDLINEASKWRQQAEEAQKRSLRLPVAELRTAMAARSRGLARDILDFENEKTITRPRTVLSAVVGGEETMRRNFEDISHYDQAAVTDFLKQFGGSVNGVARKIRPFGLDTSRLQRHIETINNIQVMRLVANDLNDLADQLETSSPRRAPELRRAPDVRRTAVGQE